MTERIATTPFGGGQFSAAIFQRQLWLEEARKAQKDNANQTGKADKWQLLRALTEARMSFHLSDRTIAVLEALLSFHQDKELDGLEDMIVFPSNAELSLRTRGMASATLRRHLAELVKGGFIIRRDSPNGKRYARKDGSGQISEAFGFNLAPFAMMAPQVFEAAERANALARAVKKGRAEITIHLRDIARVIDLAYEEGRAGSEKTLWGELQDRLRALSGRVSKNAPLEALKKRCEGLVVLRVDVEKAYLDSMSEEELMAGERVFEEEEDYGSREYIQNMSSNDSKNERHIHNSNTQYIFDKSLDKKLKESLVAGDAGEEKGECREEEDKTNPSERRDPSGNPVSLVKLRMLCPDFAQYARNGLSDWADALAASTMVRPMLGISRDAWEKAACAMGQGAAIAVLAYMVQRGAEIRSAGGYLRSLTEKAERGAFSVKPMLDSLINKETSL